MTGEERNEAIEFFKKVAEKEVNNAKYSKLAIKALEQQPCGDCISREETLKALMDEWTDFDSELMDYLIEKVRKLPSVTPQPKMGRWISVNPMVDTLMCSECGENIISEEFKSNYCPNCGCAMKGELE